MLTVLIAAVVGGLGLLHWWLSRRTAAWLGGVVPALWLAAAGAWVVQGYVDSAFDAAAIGFSGLVLLRLWDEGRQAGRRVAPAR